MNGTTTEAADETTNVLVSFRKFCGDCFLADTKLL